MRIKTLILCDAKLRHFKKTSFKQLPLFTVGSLQSWHANLNAKIQVVVRIHFWESFKSLNKVVVFRKWFFFAEKSTLKNAISELNEDLFILRSKRALKTVDFVVKKSIFETPSWVQVLERFRQFEKFQGPLEVDANQIYLHTWQTNGNFQNKVLSSSSSLC